MGRRHKSVSDLINKISESSSFKKRYHREAENHSLARTLFTIRNKAGKTKKQIADKLKVSRSAISRLGHAQDDKIKVQDLVGFAYALDLQVSIVFHRE